MKFFVSDRCIDCGMCVETCPDVFYIAAGNRVAAVSEDVSGSGESNAKRAKDNCPVSAIEEMA